MSDEELLDLATREATRLTAQWWEPQDRSEKLIAFARRCIVRGVELQASEHYEVHTRSVECAQRVTVDLRDRARAVMLRRTEGRDV